MGSKNAEWSRNMPLYECMSTAGTLNEDQREQIADAITQAHCELTGAPVALVHVIFSDIPRGNSYSGGKRATPTVIRGNIRAGRSDEVRHSAHGVGHEEQAPPVRVSRVAPEASHGRRNPQRCHADEEQHE